MEQIFTLRIIIEKWLSHQTPLVLSFIDYEQTLDSADKRTLVNAQSLNGIVDKFIKTISAI